MPLGLMCLACTTLKYPRQGCQPAPGPHCEHGCPTFPWHCTELHRGCRSSMNRLQCSCCKPDFSRLPKCRCKTNNKNANDSSQEGYHTFSKDGVHIAIRKRRRTLCNNACDCAACAGGDAVCWRTSDLVSGGAQEHGGLALCEATHGHCHEGIDAEPTGLCTTAAHQICGPPCCCVPRSLLLQSVLSEPNDCMWLRVSGTARFIVVLSQIGAPCQPGAGCKQVLHTCLPWYTCSGFKRDNDMFAVTMCLWSHVCTAVA